MGRRPIGPANMFWVVCKGVQGESRWPVPLVSWNPGLSRKRPRAACSSPGLRAALCLLALEACLPQHYCCLIGWA